MDNLLLRSLISVVSFALTIVVFVLLVRRAKPDHKIYWLIACSIAAVVWLGIVKGPVAVLVAIAVSTGYIATRLDARKLGKQVADSIGMNRSLFFTCLENSLPFYLVVLAEVQRKGTSVAEARGTLLPYVADGLLVLEKRFGRQEMIEKARQQVLPLLAELENTRTAKAA